MAEEVKITLVGEDKLSGVLDSVGKAAAGIAVGGIAALGAALAGVGIAAFKVASDFQEATAAIVIGTGASGEALAGMEASAKSLAGTSAGLGSSFGDIGAVLAEVNTRTGLTGQGLEDLSGSILELTRMTGGDAVKNTQLLTRVMGDWGVEAADAAGLTDQLFGAGQAFGIGIEDISAKVVQFGAPLRQMGFTLEESIALFGKWEKEGVNAELAIGSLRIAAGKFARDNVPLKEGLEATMEAIKGASTESEGLAIAMDVFGARAGPDMAAAIRENRFELEGAIEALRGTSGGLADAAERSLSFADRLQLVKNQVNVALLPLGDILLDIGSKLLAAFDDAGLIEKFSSAIEQLAGFISNNLLPALTEVPSMIRELIALFTGFGSDVYDTTDAFREFLIALGLPKDTINAVNSALHSVGNAIRRIVKAIGPTISSIIEFITNNVSLKDILISLGIVISAVIIPALISLIATIAPIILVIGGLITAVTAARKAWEADWLGIRSSIEDFWLAAKPVFDNLVLAMEEIPAAVGELVALFTGFGSDVYDTTDAIREFMITLGLSKETVNSVDKVIHQLGDGIRGIVEAIGPAISRVMEFITNNVNLEDVLRTLGALLSAVLLPALLSLGTTLLPILAIIAALVVRGAVMRKAWEEDWLGIRSAIEKFWEIAQPIFNELKDLAAAALSGFEEGGFAGAFEAIRDRIVEAWPIIQTALSEWASLFWDWLTGPGGALSQAGTVLGILAENIGTFLAANWPMIQEKLMEWAGKFWGWVSGSGGVTGGSGTALNTIIDAISSFLADSWPTISAKLTEWSDLFWDWVTGSGGALEQATDALDNLADAITAWAESSETQTMLSGLGENAGNALLDGLKLILDNSAKIAEVMGKLGAAITKAMPALIGGMLTAGKAVAGGFIAAIIEQITGKDLSDGVKSGLGEGWKSAVTGVIATVFPALGILMGLSYIKELIKGVTKGFPGFLKDLGKLWDKITKDFAKWVKTEFLKAVGAWFGDVVKKLKDWGKVTSEFDKQLASTLKEWSEFVADQLKAVGAWISDVVGRLGEWSKVISEFAKQLASTLKEWTTFVTDQLKAVGAWISDVVIKFGEWTKVISEFVKQLADTLKEWTKFAADQLKAVGTWISDVVTKFGEWSKVISEFIKQLANTLAEWTKFAADQLKAVGTWISDVVTKFGEWSKVIAEFVKQLANTLAEWTKFASTQLAAVGTWISDVVTKFGEWAKVIAEFAKQLASTLAEWTKFAASQITAIGTWISDAVTKVGEWTKVIAEFAKQLANTLAEWTTFATGQITAIGTWISDAVIKFGEWTKVIAEFAKQLASTLAEWGTFATGQITAVGTWISDVVTKFGEWSKVITEFAKQLASTLTTFTTWVTNTFLPEVSNWIAGIATGITNAWGAVTSALQTALEGLITVLNLPTVIANLQAIGTGIVNAIVLAIQNFQNFVLTVGNQIGSWVGEIAADVANGIGTIVLSAKNIGTGIINQMLVAIELWKTGAWTFAEWLADRLYQWLGSISLSSTAQGIKDLANAILSAIVDAIKNLTDVGKQLLDAIVAALCSQFPWVCGGGIAPASSPLGAVGTNLGQGLMMAMAQGILAGAGTVTRAMTAVISQAVQAANTQLKIASPSQVMIEMGREITSGLSQGIRLNSLMPQLALGDTIGQMSTQPVPIQPAPTTNMGGITFNQSFQSRMDNAEFRFRVEEALRELQG